MDCLPDYLVDQINLVTALARVKRLLTEYSETPGDEGMRTAYAVSAALVSKELEPYM